MKILMIGGTGVISTAVSRLLVLQGHDLVLLNRGTHNESTVSGAAILRGDISDEEGTRCQLGGSQYDVVVDWTVFTPAQAQRDIRLFSGRTPHYFFVSSASAYQRPSKHYLITERTPLANPFWEYSRQKAECEETLMEAYRTHRFPVTIVRPSLTYGDTYVPYVLTSWLSPWSLIDRMLRGKRVIVPGDGTSLWVITHNTDFARGIVGLMGKERAIGEAFHITSDEVLTWNDVLDQIAEALGVEPRAAHVSSEFITAFMPDQVGNLYGDKITSVVFDNSKLRSLVPDFRATTCFREGISRTYAYLEAHPELHAVDTEFEALVDRVIAAHDHGMSLAGQGG